LAKRPDAGGQNEPTVIVGIRLQDLLAGRDGTAFGGGPVSAETARKLACEGGIIPAVLRSDGVVLDMGRRTRLATRYQRLALLHRYGGCAAPSCDRPFEWCHMHHITGWEHGGKTDLDELIPVCTRHHSQIHDGRLVIERVDGEDCWRRPADRNYSSRGSPGRSATVNQKRAPNMSAGSSNTASSRRSARPMEFSCR
jgi:hypothetical protein